MTVFHRAVRIHWVRVLCWCSSLMLRYQLISLCIQSQIILSIILFFTVFSRKVRLAAKACYISSSMKDFACLAPFLNTDSGQMSAGVSASQPVPVKQDGWRSWSAAWLRAWWTPQCLRLASPHVPWLIPISSSSSNVHAYIHFITPTGPGLTTGHARERVVCNSSLRYLGKLTGFQLQQLFHTFARRERNRIILIKVRIRTSCEYELQPLVVRASCTQLPVLDTRIPSIVSHPSFWVEDQWDFIPGQQRFPTERVDSWVHSKGRESWRVKNVW